MKPWMSIIAVIGLCSCQTMPKNVHVFPVGREDCGSFISVADDDFQDSVGFVDACGDLTMIKAPLDGLGQIERIYVAPGKQRILIESYGEGHQFISVYDIDVIIKGHAEPELIPAEKTIDPYPYSWENIKWVDESIIEYDSQADYNVFDREMRRGKYTDDTEDIDRRWRWNVTNDTFTALHVNKMSAINTTGEK